MNDDALFFASAAEFEDWLEVNAGTSDGVWIRMAKKATGIPSLDWVAGVEAALCFGWIDGMSRRVDDEWFVQRFTPRRPRSTWSKVNREKVAALEAAGRMRERGRAEVERARADGRWDAAYDGMATARVPDDLAEALGAAGLTEVFAGLDSATRYAVLHRVQTARRPETRARRIAAAVALLAAGGGPHP